MTTEKPVERGPSAYARADAASRQVVLQLGLGVVAFFGGSILSAGAAARIGERIGPIESEWVAMVFRFGFERLWLLAMLPVFGFAIGRFTEIKGTNFALMAGMAGEVFSLLLVTAINGFDFLLEDTVGLIARGVTLFVGMMLTAFAVQAGREASEAAQTEADAVAAARKAEYAEFLAAAEGKAAPAAEPEKPVVEDVKT
jgi:hypothetical protein